MHHRDAVGALEEGERGPDRGLEVAPVVLRHEMGYDLGVGLAREGDALSAQHLAEGAVVLDDAVVDHGDLAGGVEVRMRVGLGDAAMRRPTRVPYAPGARHVLGHGLTERLDLADAAHAVYRAPVAHRDAGGIVAAIFEALEPFEKDGGGPPRAGVAYDSAHGKYPFSIVRTSRGV